MSKNNSKIKEKEEIDKIKDYLQTITDSERSEIIQKIKFYYGKYINELKIQNNKLIPNKNNTNYKSLRSKYYNNSSVNKTITNTPRFVMKFKQNIYEREIQELIHFLIGNFHIFENFMSIILFVAKKRRIIELLKLNLETSNSFIDLRASVSNIEKSFISDIIESNGEHLVSYIRSLQLPYSVKYNEITLTRIGYHPTYNKLYWFHTSQIHTYI